jgi:hypothetical protein
MADRYRTGRLHWLLWAALIGLLSCPIVGPAAAGDLDKLDTSLKLIPEDAAFYSSMLRNREQVEAIANSRAWAKLKGMPIIQMGLALYNLQAASPDSVPGKVQAALEQPEVRKLLDLAADMASQDVFVCGDASCIQCVELLQQVIGAMRYGPLVLQLSGKSRELGGNKVQAMVLLAALSENLKLIKVPNMVIGFRLGNPAAAKEELSKLENLATAVLQSQPQVQGRFQRSKIGDHEYLTLSLDGQMIPWDELPVEELRELEGKQGDADKVLARLKQLKLTIALGVRDDYLLLAIGSSTDCLARLGNGKRLLDRPELEPLAKHAERRLSSVGYFSKAMAARLTSSKRDVDDLLSTIHELLPLAGLSAAQEAKIRKDAAALAEDLKDLIPEAGALLAFSFLTERGIEGYQYRWGDHPRLDGSKPLRLLEHVGGNPVLALVGRGKVSPRDYDLLSKWVKIAYGYFEEFALPEMPPVDRRKFEKLMTSVRPLMARLDKANREMLIPALADGQAGLVLDTKLRSTQFLQALPASEQPLPMIEPALVVGVSDAALLRKACQEYHAALNGLLDALRQIEGVDIPKDLKLPEVQVTTTSSGTIYGYPLPQQWGVDEKIVPNGGVSETVAVCSLSREHTQRLLSATPLSVGGVLADTSRPLAGACVFDWAGLVDAVTPWIDLAVQRITKEQPGVDAQAGGITAQVHTLLEVLQVCRTITAETYFEDQALVSHSLLEIRDVAK